MLWFWSSYIVAKLKYIGFSSSNWYFSKYKYDKFYMISLSYKICLKDSWLYLYSIYSPWLVFCVQNIFRYEYVSSRPNRSHYVSIKASCYHNSWVFWSGYFFIRLFHKISFTHNVSWARITPIRLFESVKGCACAH